MKLYLLLTVLFLSLVYTVKGQNTSVLTQHNNNTRAGWNNHETKLNTTNVNTRQFGKAFVLPVDDQVYAQPLVIADLTISGAKHNVVYVATVNNSVYAYDGDNGKLYWQKNYSVAGQRAPKNSDMTQACGGFYVDFSGNIGIVGTPVIDSVAQTMYFVARSTNGSNLFEQYLHAVSLIDGSERGGSPVQIAASAAGTGDGSNNGVVSFDPQKNNQRQGLTLSNGIVYITFSSHCDWGPYHGWILGYDQKTLSQKIIFNDTSNGGDGGLWQSGGGPSVDSNGNLYVVTGNGSVGTTSNRADLTNRGESALKLIPTGNTLAISSYFTPSNFQALENSDLDYGCMGNFLIPNSNYYFTGCKDGTLYLLNKDNMGGFSTNSDNVQQDIPLNSSKTLRCQPTYFKGVNTEFVYVWSENDLLTAFPFNRSTNTLDISKQVVSSVNGPGGACGAELAVSSNGGAAGTGILWASYAANGNANQSVRPGILRAFDANDVTHELWDNSIVSSRDGAGNYAKFAAPTIANGHVYLPTFSNEVAVYGIIADSLADMECPTTNLALNKPAFASSSQTDAVPAANAFDGDDGTRWGSNFSDPQWIYVDLGQVDSICRVTLHWEVAIAKNFLIQVSNDAQNWTTAATITNNVDLLNYITLSAQGRYVRMYGTARGTTFGYSLYEFVVNGTVLDTCKQPTSLSSTNITTTGATLKWAATGAAGYVVKYSIGTSNNFKIRTTATNSVTLTDLGCGTNYTWQVASVCGGTPGKFSSVAAFSTQTCINCGLLPTRTFTTDVGNVITPGEACYTGITSYNIKGSGNDIYNSADQFRYVYRTFAGDGILQAKISSIDKVNAGNKAGLMFRESTDSASRNVFLGITSANGLTIQTRNVTDDPTYSGSVPGAKTPCFLRLVKQGDVYTGYVSADSISWTQLFATVNYMNTNGPISGGMAVTSRDVNQTSTAQFDQVGFYSYGGGQVNIALDKPSYGSDYSGITHTGAFANDGDTTTHWISSGGTGTKWYYVDFGQPFKLNRVNINWGADYAKNYQLQVSDDAVTWKTVQQITANTIRQNSLLLNNSARFVRIYATQTANNNGYAINELQVFGDTIATVSDDIAKGRPIVSSSDVAGGFTANNANDDDFTTRWASKIQSDPQWIYVDLGKTYNITNVNITWELDLAKNYDIQVSDDAQNWTTIKSVANNAAYTNFLNVSGLGRYIRIYGTARGGGGFNYSIYDLQVMGTESNVVPTGPVKYDISDFVVYPNPTNGQINIHFQSLISQPVQVVVSDIGGHVLKNVTVSSISGTKDITAQLAHVPAGKYVVILKTPKGSLSAVVIRL